LNPYLNPESRVISCQGNPLRRFFHLPANTAKGIGKKFPGRKMKHVVGSNQAFRQDQVAALHLKCHNPFSTDELIDPRFPTKISPYNYFLFIAPI